MNKLSISLLLLVLLGFVIFLGGKLPYFLFYIFALSLFLPLIHTFITIKRLDGKVIIPRRSLFKGDNIDICYQVDNRTPFLIPYLTIDSKIHTNLNTYQSKMATAISGREVYEHWETINLKKRGYFEVGEIEVTVEDIFKFFKFKKKISTKASLIVYPKIIKLSSFISSYSHHQGELISHDGKFEDKTRVNTLRDYVEGDNIKAIHWKLTAKKDQPMIKIYNNSVDSNIAIFLDNTITSYRDDIENRLEDKAVDIALSIIDYCLNSNLKLTLLHQDKDRNLTTYGDEVHDLILFLDGLAKLRANGKMNFNRLLLNNIEIIGRGSNIIIITPQLDKNIGATTLDLLSKSYKPFIITVQDFENKTGKLEEDVRKRLIKENIPVYNLDYYTDIKVVLEDYRE